MDALNAALDVVEQRLAGGDDVDAAELARVALTSEHHLRRMFSSLAGLPLGEYVRRRRLTLATADVVAGAGVLDVAVRHGWGSADAFTRVFRAWHGLTPTEARAPGAVLRSQPRVTVTLHVEGAVPMDHRIATTDAFRLVGVHARLPLVHEGENTALTAFTAGLPAGLDDHLLALRGDAVVPGLPGVLSVSSGFDEGRADGSTFDFHRAVANTRPGPELEHELAGAPAPLAVLEVPASTFVVFSATGSTADGAFLRAVQQLWADAYGRWFPANPYRTVEGPELLALHVDDDVSPGLGRAELWLPVEREPAST